MKPAETDTIYMDKATVCAGAASATLLAELASSLLLHKSFDTTVTQLDQNS